VGSLFERLVSGHRAALTAESDFVCRVDSREGDQPRLNSLNSRHVLWRVSQISERELAGPQLEQLVIHLVSGMHLLVPLRQRSAATSAVSRLPAASGVR